MAEWIQRGGAGASGVPGAPGPSGSSGTPAPNITSATGAAAYQLQGNASAFGFSGVITLPTGDPDYSHLTYIEVYAWAPSATSGTRIATLTAPFSGSTVNYSGGIFTQPTTGQTWSLKFVASNEEGAPTASPVSISVSVQASAVTSITSASENPATRTADPDTRLQYCHPSFVPVLNGNQVPQNVTYWKSLDNGATYTGVGPVLITTVGQAISWSEPAPIGAQTWKVAAIAGYVAVNPYVSIPASSLPSGAIVSSGFSVAALGLPAATLITSITVASGAGGSFPYNKRRPDGSQYFCIPSISYTESSALLADSNAWVVGFTTQDFDASHNPIGPEQAWDGHQVGKVAGATQVLDGAGLGISGDYLAAGFQYTRTGNVAYVRVKCKVQNRADQTNNAIFNALAATQQTGIGSGAGYVDVLVATGGAQPDGAIPADRLDPATLGHGIARDPATGKPGTTRSGSNLIFNPGFEFDLTGWNVQLTTSTGTSISRVDVNATFAHAEASYLSLRTGAGGRYDILQDVAVQPSTNYFVSLWWKSWAVDPGVASLIVYALDSSGAGIGGGTFINAFDGMTGGGAWRPISGNYVTPANCVKLRVSATLIGSVDYWSLDDVVLKEQITTGSGTEPDGKGGVKVNYGNSLQDDGTGAADAKLGYTLGTDGFGNIIFKNLPTAAGLPSLPSSAFPAGSVVLNTLDNKVYRNPSGSSWIKSTDPQDLVAGAIASGVTLNANQVNAGTFNGSQLILNLNGVTTSITNQFNSTYSAFTGLECQDNSSGIYSAVFPDRVTCQSAVNCKAELSTSGGSIARALFVNSGVFSSAGALAQANFGQLFATAGAQSFAVSATAATGITITIVGFPSVSPGAGSRQLWYDPATNNVKYQP